MTDRGDAELELGGPRDAIRRAFIMGAAYHIMTLDIDAFRG